MNRLLLAAGPSVLCVLGVLAFLIGVTGGPDEGMILVSSIFLGSASVSAHLAKLAENLNTR